MKNQKTPLPKSALSAKCPEKGKYIEITKTERIPWEDAKHMTRAELVGLKAKFAPEMLPESIRAVKNSPVLPKKLQPESLQGRSVQ